MALAFWYGGKLLSEGEYTPQTFFVIFIAIIFGGQAAGFIFGFTMSKYICFDQPFILTSSFLNFLDRHHKGPRGSESNPPPSSATASDQQLHRSQTQPR